MPAVTASRSYDSSVTSTCVRSSMALYVASTGPVPVVAATRRTPSGPSISTVAVGRTPDPVVTWTPTSCQSARPACCWNASSETSASRSSSSRPPFFFSATCLNREKTRAKRAWSSATSPYPSARSRVATALRPECLPSTMPASSADRASPTDSGVMISYVDLFLIMPSWWIPDSCWKAFAPTIALCGCTCMPVYSATSLESGAICVASTPVRRPRADGAASAGSASAASNWVAPLRRSARTTSSSAALPARSPMPLTVHSIWRAPARTPASELAVARPRSFWQCVETTTSRSA
mmetsp:Transcript_69/g.264  ORF Transcript_69/g.264 Transcript_69/m.264 type:complete len:294 (-) Transcript_69:658-1539(-)